jgi:hypothetical protein
MNDSAATAKGLLEINHFIISIGVLRETIQFLKEVGLAGEEGFVLWGGTAESRTTFRFTTAIVPDQRALRTDHGLLVVVDGEALFKVNKTLYERGEILAGQVHSHPTSAYHSDTDDHYPLVTLVGALSVVLPDFARNAPNDLRVWAWYRLQEYGRWLSISQNTRVTFE